MFLIIHRDGEENDSKDRKKGLTETVHYEFVCYFLKSVTLATNQY